MSRPGLVLAIAMACVAVLGVIGRDVSDHVEPTSLEVAGTTSAQGEALQRKYFGDSSPFAILLRGPAAALDRQGPELVRALRRDPAAMAISPWDGGRIEGLRPGPRRALILVDYHRPMAEAVRDTVPALERTMEEHIRPPVTGIQSGFATISRALEEESLNATKRAELLALPLLVIVLLIIFRSAVAALIPLAFGVVTVLAGRGILVLLSSFMHVDALSLVVCSMMGLALGVDYSLLIVSRFREELRAGGSPREAARRTRASAGRTTAFAGATLFSAILASAFVQPGSLLVSFAVTLVIVTGISVVIAAVALPALLALLGERINAGRIGGEREAGRSGLAGAIQAALRRPALALVLVAVPLLLLASPALALNIGAPGVDELPTGSAARQNAETIDEVVGSGWEAPFVLTVAAREGAIATPPRLALIAEWQRRIAARPGIREVVGPAPIEARTRPLHRLGETLASGQAAGELGKLGPGLRRASTGVERLREGVARAAAGSALLGEGSGRAETGAELLASALDRAAAGGERATGALDRLAAASKKLNAGQGRAGVAGLSLSLGMRALLPRVEGSLKRVQHLAATLEAEAEADPALRPRADQAASVARGLASTREELRRLGGVADALNDGLDRLSSGGQRLEAGTQRLADAANGLGDQLGQLQSGAQRLAGGLDELQGGAGSLQSGLSEGFQRSHPLQQGLVRASGRVSDTAAPLLRGSRALRRSSPNLFDSGYFVLSALDGAPPLARSLTGGVINLDEGGQAARLHVIPTSPFNTDGSRATGEQLLADAERLGEEGRLETGVSGGAATLNDYGEATRGGLPLVVGAVVLVTLLMLVAILRAPLLVLLTLSLNLFAVAAAMGVVSLICMIPAGYPLGGHSYLDTVGAAAIFGVTFGLSIDYAVFLIARMRERWETSGDNAEAVAYGLEKTAGVITGAAAIMAVVFLSFAAAPIATVSQMGVGLFVAILLDATVVRIVLLPSLMLLIGERVWHVPPALDRLLPELNVHGGEPEAARSPA